jgi:hypothetical protein
VGDWIERVVGQGASEGIGAEGGSQWEIPRLKARDKAASDFARRYKVSKKPELADSVGVVAHHTVTHSKS